MTLPFPQADDAVRLAWGPTGARVTTADIAVIVDVLSFSTSVTVAVERGTRVFPFRWRDDRAVAFAAERDAVLAVGRAEAAMSPTVVPTLSPADLLVGECVARLVLPSPNGSTIAATLVDRSTSVVGGCLRNATAVARWLSPALLAGRTVTVIAAGERWDSDDSLRPALEDHLGAGAILSALANLGHGSSYSPEASSAVDLYAGALAQLADRLANCVSGRELISRGFRDDVEVAADLDASNIVPVLVDGAFQAADTPS